MDQHLLVMFLLLFSDHSRKQSSVLFEQIVIMPFDALDHYVLDDLQHQGIGRHVQLARDGLQI